MSEIFNVILVFIAVVSAISGVFLLKKNDGSNEPLTEYISIDELVFMYRLPFSFFFIISGLFMITIGLKGYL